MDRPYYLIASTRSPEGVSEGDMPPQVVPVEEVIRCLVGKERIYAFAERTPYRRWIEPGDWICFYAIAKGIVAHARVASRPEKKDHPAVHDPLTHSWVFRLSDVQVYTERPVVLDAKLRSRLDAFKGRSAHARWAWFVRRVRLVTEHDFRILTRQE